MRSVTSCFNMTLFRKNLSRFWPIWGLYGFLWLMLLPVNVLVNGEHMDRATTRLLPLNYLAGSISTATALSFLFGILAAMAVFSYLYNSRSAGFFHTLPMRREGLFLTNYLSGLAFLIVPNVVVFLLSVAVEGAFGLLVFSSLFTWLVVTSMLNLFFYSFAVFCAMFTGHILALPAFYGILNVLAAGVCYLFQGMASRFLFGFTGATWLEDIAVWLTPIALLGCHTGIDYAPGMDGAYFTGLGYVFLLALVGVALAGLALVVYRRRELESAGDVVSISWVRPVFQYGVAFCCAIALGTMFDNIFSSLLPRSAWVLLVWMLVWGAFGCFVAAMLLRKSFWVFKPCWKGCTVFLAVLAAAMFLMELDGFGFESRVPATAQVQSVFVAGVESHPDDDLEWVTYGITDPALIEQVTQLHQRIVEEKGVLEEAANTRASGWTVEEDGLEVQTEGGTDLRLTYTLIDGSVMERYYYLPVSEETLADLDSPAALLQALLNTPGLTADTYLSGVTESDRLVDAVLTAVWEEGTARGTYSEEYLPAEALTELEEAVKADLAAGDLGRRYLLDDRARKENCCYCDLELTYRMTDSGKEDTSAKTPGTAPAGSAEQSGTHTIRITLQKSASNTMAVLEKYGIDTDTALLSQAQRALLEQ
ncbi:ABC transporter permease [Intestinimonas massiliensis (ex Afouda et al. 2020)]|uniref:ABC transporter permease n=1 Tax=Intestinimonas massiliensis (ex Afouda et al. 2020) TaxID=1673721 RepID=UPI0010309E52|nr:ABC transporter permease [Intestinimonas massiliensis (ex Afouda et al. 2020)]